ncbi:glucose 1-dehydrogenase [Gammaproteobacteria bacterium]|nr:glucose 1-dehydrogenase [Gammaproteobacteria bacterium]
MENSEKLFSLKNKVAIVTGAYGDLGYSISKSYLDAGAYVVLTGLSKNNLNNMVQQLDSFSDFILPCVVDVSDTLQVDEMVEKVIDRFGKIDILVTAAGVQHREPIQAFNHDEWNKVLQVNLTGTFLCAQAVAKHMMVRKMGRIIMISSLTAEIGIPNIAAYAASRGGIKQLGKTMAVELASSGITVNCVGPGRFKTKMTEDVFSDESKRKDFLNAIPMQRAGIPEDLSGILIFLASDSSSYITGQSIYVDGGWLAGGGNVAG